AELEPLLADYDLDCTTCHARHAAVLEPALGAQADVLTRQIAQFDFDQALSTLRAAMEAWPAPN
ncbi:hypothetical protein, partial [Zoogloea sp.]|uniref:hypothetical protein n=1 Tax=Zoogloea sp. TaxID=49181 RepID=UPI0035B3D6EC